MLARTKLQEAKRIYPIPPTFLSAFVYAPILFARNVSRTSLHTNSKKVDFDFVGALSDSVVDHSIMSRLDSALDSCVRLEVKIKVVPGIRW